MAPVLNDIVALDDFLGVNDIVVIHHTDTFPFLLPCTLLSH